MFGRYEEYTIYVQVLLLYFHSLIICTCYRLRISMSLSKEWMFLLLCPIRRVLCPTMYLQRRLQKHTKRLAGAKEPQKKGPYIKVTPEYKAKVAKFTSINGNSVTARKYSELLGKNLNESTVRLWVKNYKLELERKRKAGWTNTSVHTSCSRRWRCDYHRHSDCSWKGYCP